MPRMPLLALILLLVTPLGYAQSLGEAAAREKEKRAKRGPTATRAYTGDDLKAAPKPGEGTDAAGAPRPPATAGGESGGGEGASESEGAEGRSSSESEESAWRQRVQERRAAIASAEQAIRASEERLARLMADREPVALSDPNRLQTIENLKNETRLALESARRELADARQALEDLEEEARRNNVPPGWLR